MPDIYIPKGVPAHTAERRVDPELVGSMGAIGEIPIEHQDIHLETRDLAKKLEQNSASLTDSLFETIPNLEQRLQRLVDSGAIGGSGIEYKQLVNDLAVVKQLAVERVNKVVSELILHPEQITGDNEKIKEELYNLLKELMQTCEGTKKEKK